MLSSAKLSKSFWAKTLSIACYLVNRSPSHALEGNEPLYVQSWKVNYSHLRVFGCKPFERVHKEQRAKLDSKAIKCIFLGYGDDKFCYRLWDPKNKKLIHSRDVVFKENQTFGDS